MGGAAVLRHAAGVAGYGLRERPDAVVAVSSTGPWSTRSAARGSMRRVHLLAETGPGRLVARRLLGTRIDPRGWRVVPVPPVDAVRDVTAPLLVVHGDRDGYFGLEHPRSLGAAAPAAEVWVEAGFGHAETAIAPELIDRIGAHLATVLAARDGAP